VPDASPDFLEILRVLIRHEVDFIVVGGVSAVLQGAPISTFDLDIVHSRTPENIGRLATALAAIDAHSRVHTARRVSPGLSHLTSPGHQLLMTSFGPLDVLGEIGTGRDYAKILDHSITLEVAAGIVLRVLDLPTLILAKEERGDEKDLAVLPILRRLLEEQQRR